MDLWGLTYGLTYGLTIMIYDDLCGLTYGLTIMMAREQCQTRMTFIYKSFLVDLLYD